MSLKCTWEFVLVCPMYNSTYHLPGYIFGSWLPMATVHCPTFLSGHQSETNSFRSKQPVIGDLDILSGSSYAVNITLHMIGGLMLLDFMVFPKW